jgi:predicted alpha/beta superfamily hydrolase
VRFVVRFIILIFVVVLFSFPSVGDDIIEPVDAATALKTETFTFSSNGVATKGKIFLPISYETNRNLPAIYLIDFTEQQFNLATDEFEKVVGGVQQIQGFDAVVVTLEKHLDIDSKPEALQEYYDIFKDMTSYVDSRYTNNISRTFVGRGSEAGIVLMTLFLENSECSVFENFIVTDPAGSFNSAVIQMIEKDDFPKNKKRKKLHFSFSTSNNHDQCTKLIKLIEVAEYPWLEFESLEYTKSNYENTYPVSFAEGIKYVFSLITT